MIRLKLMDQKLDEILFRWSQAISALCKTGLAFTSGTYEADRYEEILKIAVEIELVARSISSSEYRAENRDLPTGNLSDLNQNNLGYDNLNNEGAALLLHLLAEVEQGVPGYVTPKVAVGAVVSNDKNQILLIQRSDSGVWLYPTGWTEVGYSPAEVVAKEVFEETGIIADPLRPVAILDGMRMGFNRVPLYSLVFYCRATGGTLNKHPLECLDVGWFDRNNLPSPLAGDGKWVDFAFKAIDGSHDGVYFDPVRDQVWKSGEIK